MEVHFTPEQQAQIAQVATKAGTVPERLVTNVVVRYLAEEARFLAAVEKGLVAAERGEFIEEEVMDARLEAMFKAWCASVGPSPPPMNLLNIKNYLQQNYPHFAEPTVRAIYQRIRLLKTSPNRGRPGHRSGTK